MNVRLLSPNIQDPQNHPIRKRFDTENLANLSNHEAEQILRGQVYLFFHEQFKHCSKEQLRTYKLKLKSIYSATEHLFIDKDRSSWEPYFYHLLETAYIRMEEGHKWNTPVTPNIFDVFLSILHDTIEDTSKDFDSLKRTYDDEKLAFGVHLISKKSFYTYIEDEKDWDDYKKIIPKIWENNISIDEHIINTDWLSEEDTERYNELRAQYRKVRTKVHFSHYKDFDTFFAYAKEEAKSLRVNISEQELEELCHRVLQVKFCDRLHNLRTMWHIEVATIQRKIEETKNCILPLAQEISPHMAQKMQEEIKKLREIIRKTTQNQTKEKITNHLPAA